MTDSNVDVSDFDSLVDLFAAVASGDARRQDVVATLKDKGVDTLDVLVECLLEVARRSKHEPPEYLDPRKLASATPQERSPSATHPVSDEPFLMNGVLYDPADINRFDDRDLFFVAGRPDAPIFATDDRNLMTNWLQLLYLDSVAGSDTVGMASGMSAHAVSPHTNFWENTVFSGDRIELAPGRAYSDLTKLHHGFLGTGGTWNDYISSVQMIGTRSGLLWENINFGGSEIAITYYRLDLPAGWNDRASSIGAL